MRRVAIIGASCSGKTTLAACIAQRMGVPFTEFDAIAWGPNWSLPSDKHLLELVKARTAPEGWVFEGIFPEHLDAVWSQADTLIFLNYPMSLVFWRALCRTLKRCITRERLGEHNVETWRRTFFSAKSQLLWVIHSWRKRRRDFPKVIRRPEYGHLQILEFTSPRQTERWLAKLKPAASAPGAMQALTGTGTTESQAAGPRREVAVVCGGDEAYAMPLAVMLSSASANLALSWRLRVFLMDGGISAASRRRLQRKVAAMGNVDLEWRRMGLNVFDQLPTLDYLKTPMYMRLQMEEVLPPELERVIYLDADLLVEGDLSELWREEFGGATLLAVEDFGEMVIRPELALPGVDESLRRGAAYFNSGVLVIDLNRWRKDQVGQAALEYVRRFKSLIEFPDQDALNAVLFGKWRRLDLSWNAQVDNLIHPEELGDTATDATIRSRREELLYHPRIQHYAGYKKPWNAGRFRPVRKRFIEHLHASGWHNPLGLLLFHVGWAWSTFRLGWRVHRRRLATPAAAIWKRPTSAANSVQRGTGELVGQSGLLD